MTARHSHFMQQTLAEIGKWMTDTVWRDGGQRGARRNAWRAMVDDTQRSRERAEVEATLKRIADQSDTASMAAQR